MTGSNHLSGQCEIDFKCWYLEESDHEMSWHDFVSLPITMQWGVYLEFFQSKGYTYNKPMVYEMSYLLGMSSLDYNELYKHNNKDGRD